MDKLRETFFTLLHGKDIIILVWDNIKNFKKMSAMVQRFEWPYLMS